MQSIIGGGDVHRGFVVAVAVVLAELLLGWAAAAGARGAGRRLEQRLHQRWSHHLAHMPASWVATRPVSDLVERVHGLHRARALPQVLGVALRAIGAAVGAAVAIVVVLPASAPAVLLLMVLPVVGVRLGWARVAELDLRARSLAGSLSRFLLDGLLGLTVIRHHQAARAVRWEQGRCLAQWRTAARHRVRATALVELAVGLAVLAPAALLLAITVRAGLSAATALMILLLALSIPMAVDELMTAGRLLPDARNRLLRFLEVVDAAAEASPTGAAPVLSQSPSGGAELMWSSVTVARGGRPVIEDLTLRIGPGERVAVVGRSGSAKSTLLDTVLGLAEVVEGVMSVDGVPVAENPAAVRAVTAWASSASALWDRSLDTNVGLSYPPDPAAVTRATQRVGADVVRDRLQPDVDQLIGTGGRLLSGGEGQLIRAARAAHAHTARLLIGDEATRGLDRPARRRLLHGLRAAHPAATVLWVTHDPAEAAEFDRVIVMADGAVVEDGPPAELTHAGGPFTQLLSAARAAGEPLGWRSISLDDCLERDTRDHGRPLVEAS